MTTFPSLLAKVQANNNLSEIEAQVVITSIMQGGIPETDVAVLLTYWRDKGVTVDELTGAARAMRALATKIDISPGVLLDVCGTGGDGLETFNISTVAAFIVAGAGVRVAKHGNRGSTSRCGSADLLEELGVKIDPGPEIVRRCIERIGIGFLFAPQFHPAMKNVASVRKKLKFRTIFNLLGPLTNPSNVNRQLVGVSEDPKISKHGKTIELIAHTLERLGSQRFLVVHDTQTHMDEVSTIGSTRILEFNQGQLMDHTITPEQFGFTPAQEEDLVSSGRDPETCANIALEILKGGKEGQIKLYRDATLFNAGCALYVGGEVAHFEEGIRRGIDMAVHSLESGRAFEKFQQMREMAHPS